VTSGSSESDENDIKSPTQGSLPDALTTIKREMPPRNDQGKPVYNWNKLCAVVLNALVKLRFRKAFGFRTLEALQVALYHQLGHLPQPQLTHRFC